MIAVADSRLAPSHLDSSFCGTGGAERVRGGHCALSAGIDAAARCLLGDHLDDALQG